VSHSWPLVPLGEILAERDEVPDAGAIATGEIPIISKIGFQDGQIQLRSGFETKTGMISVRPGDIVVSGINAAKGAVAIYGDYNCQPIAATIHYSAYAPKEDRVEVRFLWWLLRSALFRNILEANLPGGIKTELKPKRLLPIQVPLPPLDQQRRIVARIAALAATIDEARRLRKQNTVASESAMNVFIDSALEPFSDLGRFEEIVTLRPRSGPSFPSDREWKGTCVLMPSSVTGFGVDTTKVEFGLGNEVISQKDRLESGDILIARGNKREQVGNAGIVPERAEGWVCANLLMRMRVDPKRVDQNFCIYWLRSPRMRHYVKVHMKGTSPNIQKINQQTILDFPFPTNVSLAEQCRIVAYLDGLQAKVDALKRLQAETVAELEALLPSILNRAFRGEL
jgi:type I restriction enzyme S subunit